MSGYTSSNLRTVPERTFRCMEKARYRYACIAPDKKDEAANAAGLFPIPSIGWARCLFREENLFLIPLIQG
jgi:hypothetical protein